MSAAHDPIARFAGLFEQAKRHEASDATAMTLATAGADGAPAARIVLLKGFDARGFVFYTNRHSPKGRELAANPRAALVFHWPVTKWQVRITGRMEPVTDEESDAYYASRPRGSQLGAWASHQSEVLNNRADLVKRYFQLKLKYAGRPVPRPPHWGGYRVVPERIEFWRDRRLRLHDRFLYTRQPDGSWTMERLSP
jgi:pyridoxamine 5'-phosphate oxidase